MRLRKKGLNIELLCDPASLRPGVYPQELKSCVLTRTCKWMFIATLFMIVPKWQ